MEAGLSKLFILLEVRVLDRPRRPRLCSDKPTLTGQTIRATESPLHQAAPVVQGLEMSVRGSRSPEGPVAAIHHPWGGATASWWAPGGSSVHGPSAQGQTDHKGSLARISERLCSLL